MPAESPVVDTAAQPAYLTDQLRSLILSRIDSLDEGARRAAHVGAVLGHAFPATLLRRVLGQGLRTPDIALPGESVVGTRAMGDAVLAALRAA